MKHILGTLILLTTAIAFETAHAQSVMAPTWKTPTPARSIQEIYPSSSVEKLVRVTNPNQFVLMMDYNLLLRDFPHLHGRTREQIDKWILAQTGFMSQPQAAQQTVNSEITTNNEWRWAYRPPGYGRAAILPVEGGMIDVKGLGVGDGRQPSHASHRNGLASAAELMREMHFENVIRASFAHAQLPHETVGTYGIVSLGFDVRYPDGSSAPAAIILRQAIQRSSYEDSTRAAWLPGSAKWPILQHISKYGFYTGWEGNIQGVDTGSKVVLFDFGHWIAYQGWVEEAGVGVNPNVALNFNDWGWDSYNGPNRAFDQWRTSQMDKPWNYAWQTAFAIKFGNGRQAALDHYNTMVVPYLKKLGVGEAPVVSNDTPRPMSCSRLAL